MNAESTIDADALARAIVAKIPKVPLESTLWDLQQIADYFRVSVRTAPRLVAKPRFPEPIRPMPSERRWFAGDVIEWARLHADR